MVLPEKLWRNAMLDVVLCLTLVLFSNVIKTFTPNHTTLTKKSPFI